MSNLRKSSIFKSSKRLLFYPIFNFFWDPLHVWELNHILWLKYLFTVKYMFDVSIKGLCIFLSHLLPPPDNIFNTSKEIGFSQQTEKKSRKLCKKFNNRYNPLFISFPGSFSLIWNKAKAQCYYQMLLFNWNCFIIKYNNNNLHNLPRSFCLAFIFLIWLGNIFDKQKTKFNKNKTSDLILKRLGGCQVKKRCLSLTLLQNHSGENLRTKKDV